MYNPSPAMVIGVPIQGRISKGSVSTFKFEFHKEEGSYMIIFGFQKGGQYVLFLPLGYFGKLF
jgi:hypothetical protein